MRLTVFGGTSPTGQHLVQQALQAGHAVTALARNPAKLAARDGLTVIEGHLTDALGTPSITDPADRREPVMSLLVGIGKLFKIAPYRTMVGIGQIVRASDLAWTIVRLPLLTDRPRTERVNVRTLGDKGGIRLSRANAAAYFLQQAEDTTRFGQAPLITDT